MQPYVRSKAEEIANSVSYGIGVAASFVFLPALVIHAFNYGTASSIVGCVLFCITMFATYLSSTLYHALPDGRARDIVLRLDHGSIFLLIAGTYALFGLHQACLSSITYFTIIWTIAVIGLLLKLFDKVQNIWVLLVLYVAMGWMATTAVLPLFEGAATIAKPWLIAGGAAYTGGVLFYAFGERVKYCHLFWHCAVLAGTVLHAVAVVTYLAA
jgi:hemolysin III